MEIPTKIQIKGIREGLLVTLGEGPWEQVQETFLEHLDEQREFMKGARLALDVGNHMLKAAELGQLRNHISEREVTLWAVLSNSPTTERTAQTLGLETRLTKPKPETAAPQTRYQDADPAILVHRTLRSGYSLQNPGHVIVLGDVNPGAEIIAGGDVVVWGRLRGMVHAGAGGNESAVICALDLAPTQLRIAGAIAITPQRRGKSLPEMARIVDGRVVAEQWNPKKRE